MNENLEAVKRRVKKLFALSKSPNENEAWPRWRRRWRSWMSII
jgi:hypothetical protein